MHSNRFYLRRWIPNTGGSSHPLLHLNMLIVLIYAEISDYSNEKKRPNVKYVVKGEQHHRFRRVRRIRCVGVCDSLGCGRSIGGHLGTMCSGRSLSGLWGRRGCSHDSSDRFHGSRGQCRRQCGRGCGRGRGRACGRCGCMAAWHFCVSRFVTLQYSLIPFSSSYLPFAYDPPINILLCFESNQISTRNKIVLKKKTNLYLLV